MTKASHNTEYACPTCGLDSMSKIKCPNKLYSVHAAVDRARKLPKSRKAKLTAQRPKKETPQSQVLPLKAPVT